MLSGGTFDPRQRVIIAVTVNGSTEVLMDGIITKQDYTPDSAAGKSTLTVTGIDLTALMDFIDLTGIPYPALPEFLIVEGILAKYAVLGVIPLAIPASIPTFENPLENLSSRLERIMATFPSWRARRARFSISTRVRGPV